MCTIFIIYNLQTKLFYNLHSAIQGLFLCIIMQFDQFFCMGLLSYFYFVIDPLSAQICTP